MKVRFSKCLLILLYLSVFVFTGAVLYVFGRMGAEPSTLIISFFGFVATALGSLAAVRNSKEKTTREGMKNASELEAEIVEP